MSSMTTTIMGPRSASRGLVTGSMSALDAALCTAFGEGRSTLARTSGPSAITRDRSSRADKCSSKGRSRGGPSALRATEPLAVSAPAWLLAAGAGRECLWAVWPAVCGASSPASAASRLGSSCCGPSSSRPRTRKVTARARETRTRKRGLPAEETADRFFPDFRGLRGLAGAEVPPFLEAGVMEEVFRLRVLGGDELDREILHQFQG